MSNNHGRKVDTAAGYLDLAGMKILDRAYTCTWGTADVVASDRGWLVVVSVRDSLPRSLTRRDKIRLRRVGVEWMASHGKRFDRLRVDVVAVTLLPMGQSNMEHAKGMDQ